MSSPETHKPIPGHVALLSDAYGVPLAAMAQITGVAEDRLQSGQLDSHDLSRVAAAYDLPATFFETETGSEIDQLRLLATLRATPAAALRLRGKPGR